MIPRPPIFISAVSKELQSARQLVANTLQFLGYEPVWQDIFGTEQGDLREMLREKIDKCKGVVQIVGQCYGAEPTVQDEQFGRISYTQYEALYARQRKKKVWYLILAEDFPSDPHDAESDELCELQMTYRKRLQTDTHLFHPLNNLDAVEKNVLKMRGELKRLRRGAKLWAWGITVLLALIIALVIGILFAVQPSPITAEQANTAFIARNYPSAFDAYVQLSDADPDNVHYHRRIEECARMGRMEKPLLDRYLTLVRQQPNNAVFHNYLGNAYLMIDPRDEDGEARKHYELAMRLDPKFPSPLANLGIIASRMGKSGKAEKFFKRYLKAEPDDAQGLVNFGLLYVARVEKNAGDREASQNAKTSLEKALGMNPALASAYKGLGRLFSATGHKGDALNAFQHCLALNYDQPEVQQQVELLAWESGGARLSGDDFKTRNIRGGGKIVPAVVIAMQLLDKRQFRQAEAACLEWTRLEPENPLAWRLLSRACKKQGHLDDARKAFARMVALLKPDSQ